MYKFAFINTVREHMPFFPWSYRQKLPARKSRKANEEGLSDGSNIQLALKLKLFMKGNLD